MHLLHRFQGFFAEHDRMTGFAWSPLISSPSNASFHSTAKHVVHRLAQDSYGIHTFVRMASVEGFYGSLRDTDLTLVLTNPGAASRFEMLQLAMATRCGWDKGMVRPLEHLHLVSREASGMLLVLSRLNASTLLQLLSMQAASWCRKLGCTSRIGASGDDGISSSSPSMGSMSAAPPLLLTYQIYYSLLALQNMILQDSKVTDLLELWQSTFVFDEGSSDELDPFMLVVSDLLTLFFCLKVSKVHLMLREIGMGARAIITHVWRFSMNYFDFDIRYNSVEFQHSRGIVADCGSIMEDVAIRYIRRHRALLNLDFVWAFCEAKGYLLAAQEVLLPSASSPASPSLYAYLDPLFGKGCIGGGIIRLDCLMESVEVIAGKSRVVLCTLMLYIGSILSKNRQLGIQLLLSLFPYVGPQAARIEIFRSSVERHMEGVTGGDDPSGKDPYLISLEDFHEYATGLLKNQAKVEGAITHRYDDVPLQLLWLEASLMLSDYFHQQILQCNAIGHFHRRVLDLLLYSPVLSLRAAESTVKICLKHGFLRGVEAVTDRWLESILSMLGEEPTECDDTVSRFENAIVTMHVLRKRDQFVDAAAVRNWPFHAEVQAMLEAVQRCVSHLLSKHVLDLEARCTHFGTRKLQAVDLQPQPQWMGSFMFTEYCEVQQLLEQLLRLCWKVSIMSAAVDSSDNGCEVDVLVEIALEAILLANMRSIRLGDTLPPSIVRRAYGSIRLSALGRFRGYVVDELLALKHRDNEVGGDGPYALLVASLIVELLGRSIGLESMLDVIEREPVLSRCLNYSLIERLRF